MPYNKLDYNNPHAQLLLPAEPVPAADGAARSGGSQFAEIRLLHLQLHLLLCATHQPFSLLHALAPGRPQARGGLSRVANRSAASRVQSWRNGCRYDSRFAFASWAALSRGRGGAARRRSAGSDKNLVERRLHKP